MQCQLDYKMEQEKMKAEINKQNIISKKGAMSYLQILILIIGIFAFAYLISDAFEFVDAQEEEEEINLEEEITKIVEGEFTQTEENIITNIETSVEGFACCEKTKEGIYCQFTEGEKCDTNFRSVPTECENIGFCKLGCCYSTKTGWCNENTPRRSCEASGGQWKDDQYCNIAECQRGCCVLGRNALWTTERNCRVEAGFQGLQADFRQDVNSEIECIFLAEKDDEGACVYSGIEKTCKITTRESCENTGGDFYKNTLCSNPSLDTDCQAKDHIGCDKNPYGDGKSVYWFDSCGNKEEAKEECSIFTGTICGLVDGEHKCKSIDCEVEINGQKVKKKNGESWCEYDGTIGDGKDVVGSRHWKHICFMGEERVEPCQDYRNQICVQSDTDLGNGETFSEAGCRINNWRSCIDYNTIEDKAQSKKKCEENPDCYIKNVVGADKFAFNYCVPKYPPGFDLTTESGGKDAEMVCGMASQSCTVIYVKKITGKWDCEINCACEKESFTQAMNNFCTSLGDCGAYVNYDGEITEDGYSTSRAPRLGQSYFNSLKKYATPKQGQKAEPGDLSFLGQLGQPYPVDYDPSDPSGAGLKGGMGVLGAGFMLQVISYIEINAAGGLSGAISSAASQGSALGATQAPSTIGALGNALAGFGAMVAVGSILIKVFGIEGEGAEVALIASAVAGAYTAFLVLTQAASIEFAFGFIPYDPLTLIILVIIIIIIELIGVGDTKKKHVSFNCHPWQPPTGGGDCSECNGDALRPCSAYRCKSLGQNCELINQGTDQQMCVDNSPDDVSSPRISPLYGRITEGYEYHNIKDTGFEVVNSEDKTCIPEFTPVMYGIETNKPAQCKIGSNPMETYNDMNQYFGGSNLYLTNHTTLLNIPSPEAFRNQYNLTEEQIAQIGDVNFYVKCKSVNNVVNVAAFTIRSCVEPGPDLTPPYVTRADPPTGGYMKYGATEKNVKIWTNEPAECKWSSENEGYEQMENEMNCQTDMEDYGLYGWPCNTNLTNLEEENNFYIRCQDTSDNKNTMQDPYIYSLTRSLSELQIIEINPADGQEVIAGFEPVTLDLEVRTYGGAELGKAECSFKFREEYDYIGFYDTFSTYHKQTFSSIVAGSYTVYIKCEDVAGNVAENMTEFDVKIDGLGPTVTRVYYDGSLKIATDENAVCGYSFTDSKCRFDMENATDSERMTEEGKEHTADWQTDSTYYIKCKDSYGNEPGRCSIIVRPYNIL